MSFEFTAVQPKKTVILMEDCGPLQCSKTLARKMKEHRKKKGRDHVCNAHCARYFNGLHHAEHAWYNERKLKK